MTLAICLTALLLASEGPAQAQVPQPISPPSAAAPVAAKDPAALALLKRMCDRVEAARTFNVRGRVSLELPLPDGILATYFNEYETAVRRPDGLAVRRHGDLSDFSFAYDGKAMTVYVPSKGMWGTTSAPATLDAMLPVAGEQLGLNMPFDELLVANPCAAITAGITDAALAGKAIIQGKQVQHVVLLSPELRLEYWIDPATALPARSLVVYVYHPLQPHFQVEFADWKLDPKLPAATFALPMPKGATQVDFRDASSEFR